MNYRYAIFFAALISLFAITSFADDKPPTAKEINALIQQLVSLNRAPVTDGPEAEYPVGYDRNAQDRVRGAWRKLYDMEGHLVFPYLFDHFDDQRYSFTADAGSSDTNWTVGRACSEIVICHVQPYEGLRHRRTRPSYSEHFKLRTSAGAKLWWEPRKDRSLRQLQIEALKWIIAAEAKTPSSYSPEERVYLKDLLRKLGAAKTPLPPSVPWAQ